MNFAARSTRLSLLLPSTLALLWLAGCGGYGSGGGGGNAPPTRILSSPCSQGWCPQVARR